MGKEDSISSSLQEFVRENSLDGTKKLDFVAYRRALRQKQLLDAINRKDSIKIVGRKIEKPGTKHKHKDTQKPGTKHENQVYNTEA